MGLKAKTEL